MFKKAVPRTIHEIAASSLRDPTKRAEFLFVAASGEIRPTSVAPCIASNYPFEGETNVQIYRALMFYRLSMLIFRVYFIIKKEG